MINHYKKIIQTEKLCIDYRECSSHTMNQQTGSLNLEILHPKSNVCKVILRVIMKPMNSTQSNKVALDIQNRV